MGNSVNVLKISQSWGRELGPLGGGGELPLRTPPDEILAMYVCVNSPHGHSVDVKYDRDIAVQYRSMLPDVIDESLLTNGVRREELFYTFFIFASKLSNGLALGISTAMYKYVNA